MRTTLLTTVLAAAMLVPAAARGQLPADSRWRTIESAHFRVTYEDGLEHLARRAAASAERAHAGLRVLVADAPRGMIDIVVTDNVDFSNGFAMPFPSNRIVIYAKPSVDVLELQYIEDWIDMVVVHELAHIFHFDVTGRVGRALRAVFGRMPFSWPFFPVVGTPRWATEGLAVGIESTLTGAGRIHGSYNEMVIRTAILEGGFDTIDRLSAVTPVWPGLSRIYIYGGLFMDYLTRRYGPDATARIVRGTADAIIPPALWFGHVARRELGVTFRTAYEEWQRELRERFAPLARKAEQSGITHGQPLTGHGAWALYPRFSPDGSAIAYAANDWRSTARIRAIDAHTGAELWSRRANDLAPVAWLPDGSVVTSDLEFVDRFRIFSDLRRADGTRITRGERVQHPDATRDGARIVAVQNGAGTNRIVLVDPHTGGLRPLTPFDEHAHWTTPRFSPDGERIAAGRWRVGGDFEIVVLDTTGTIRTVVTRSTGVSEGPAWSPDGRWLLFWSDRSGIPNIYAADMARPGDAPRIRQVTAVLSGAYHPDISPDGQWIAYAAYRRDGFRIERIPFDTATWRDAATAPAGPLLHRPLYDVPASAEEFTRAVREAVATADTTAGDPAPYSAVRHVRPFTWVPILDAGGYHDDFAGIWTYGADLVDRHRWDLGATVSVRSGQTQGRASYTFAGLPTSPLLGLHPTITLSARRNWDLALRDTARQRFIDEREDIADIALGLTRARWRAWTSFTIAAELVHRSRHLIGFPAGTTLRDPDDHLYGARAAAIFASFTTPPFAISRENGAVIQLAGRQRHDRNPRTFLDPQRRSVTIDGSYRELTTWNAGYIALPLAGWARHVIALRASGMYREGPGAAAAGIGGTSGAPAGFRLPGLTNDLGGTGRLLPVRGFEQHARTGTRAWTASAEYRLPLLSLTTALRPLPIYADRVAAAAFLDAGHAWCTPHHAARLPRTACSATTHAAPPLVAAGGEITTFLTVYTVPIPLRAGIAFPIQGTAERRPTGYLLLSRGF